MSSFPLVDLFLLGSAGWTVGGSLAGGGRADDDLVCGVGAWNEDGEWEVLAEISPAHLSSAGPQLAQGGLRMVSS